MTGRAESRTVSSAVGSLLQSGEASSELAGSSAHGDGEGTAPAVSTNRGGGPAVIVAFTGGVRSDLSVRDPEGGGSLELPGETRAEFNAILPVRALAMIMFRSGGCAAWVAEFHPCSPRVPPTSDASVR
eukprot:6212735-Pleurochrysis_carterae.AAC.1